MNRGELAVVVIPKKRLMNAKVVDIEQLKRNPEGVELPQIAESNPQETDGGAGRGRKTSKTTKEKKVSQSSAPPKLPAIVSSAK